jgi:hypothetical protein
MRSRLASRFGRTAVVTGGALAMLAAIGVRAQQAPPAQRTMIPMAASSILRAPDDHYGQYVSMPAAIEQVLSKTAFSVDQDKSAADARQLLIIAPSLQEAPEVNTYVTIVGEVFKFDPAEVARRAKGYTLDLPADVVEKFRGGPAILATSVISAKLVDIAKAPPPPLTPEEIAFDKTMKTVQPTFGSLRTALDGSSAADAKQHAATLKNAFIEAQLFFKNRGTADAAGWAQDALKLVETIEKASGASQWDEARTSAASLQQLCATCHAAHRERMDDGTFRVRGSR